ncbi:MAG: PAS domain S-box protein [Gammaproteobacteria bacterium]|nr:MAG: PAS domain S-box protein [Gammaproteobacteria bacterium]
MRNPAKFEIKQAQEEHLEVYKRLIESIGDGYIIYSHKLDTGELTYLSTGFESVFGIAKEKVLNKPWDSVINWLPEDVEKANAINARYFDNKTEQTEDVMRFIHPDGRQRTIRITEYPVLDDSGIPVLINGICEDITERKQIEKALLDKEEQYRLAMKAARAGLWDWDVTTGMVYYNQSWSQILGEEGAISIYSNWEDRVHPEDKSRTLKSLRSHLDGETTDWQEEHRLRHADGNYIWVLARGQVVKRDSHGSPLRMVGTITDINDRKLVESELHESKHLYQKQLGAISEKYASNHNASINVVDCRRCTLRDTVLCGNLTSDNNDHIRLPITEHTFEKSETIYQEGKMGDFIFTIRSGMVKMNLTLPSGGQKIVRLLPKGEVIGMKALLNQPYYHTATTYNKCEVCKIPVALIDDLRKHSLALNHNLMVRWDKSVNDAETWLAKMNTGAAHDRITHLIDFLVSNSESAPEFVLPSRGDISSMLGITMETASRIIASLKREGVITFHGNGKYKKNSIKPLKHGKNH